jgi:hypothetical protein
MRQLGLQWPLRPVQLLVLLLELRHHMLLPALQ